MTTPTWHARPDETWEQYAARMTAETDAIRANAKVASYALIAVGVGQLDGNGIGKGAGW